MPCQVNEYEPLHGMMAALTGGRHRNNVPERLFNAGRVHEWGDRFEIAFASTRPSGVVSLL